MGRRAGFPQTKVRIAGLVLVTGPIGEKDNGCNKATNLPPMVEAQKQAS